MIPKLRDTIAATEMGTTAMDSDPNCAAGGSRPAFHIAVTDISPRLGIAAIIRNAIRSRTYSSDQNVIAKSGRAMKNDLYFLTFAQLAGILNWLKFPFN